MRPRISSSEKARMATNDNSSVDDLVDQLFDPKAQTRRDAAQQLFRLGNVASAAVPALLQATKDDDNVVRYNAIAALGSTGASGPHVIQSLLEVLLSPVADSGLRGIAAVKLGQLGPPAEPFLIELLRHPDGVVRRKAADGLGMGKFDRSLAIPHLVKLLEDTDEDVRSCAASSLEQSGLLAEPLLEQALENGGGHTACYAARAILKRRPDHRLALHSLIAGLADRDPAVRRRAAWFLGYAGPYGGPAVQRLTEALEDEDAKVRSAAAQTMGDIGLPSKTAEPALVRSVKGLDPNLRDSSAYALGQLRAASPAAIDALAEAVHDQYWDVQVSSIQALGKIGPQARAAVPSLRRALILTAVDPEMRERIVEALRLIESPGSRT
jgi:HEAT repeat protein